MQPGDYRWALALNNSEVPHVSARNEHSFPRFVESAAWAPVAVRNNKPAGFDVDYCNDLAAALGVKVEVLNLTWGDRIPSLISGKTDVVIGSTSDTLERAKSVGFTYPYFVFKFLRYALDSWGPMTIERLFDVEPHVAGYLSTIFDWVGFAGVVFAGYASDRFFGFVF